MELHRQKRKCVRPEDDQNLGDCYTFVAIERNTKLVLNVAMGKRDQLTTNSFIEGLRDTIAPRTSFQITTDGFAPYRTSIPDTFGDYRAVISVENSGLTNLRGAGKVEVADASEKVVQETEFPSVVILPSCTQRLPVVLSGKLTDGDYTLRTRVNLGNGEIQEAVLKFRLPSPPE